MQKGPKEGDKNFLLVEHKILQRVTGKTQKCQLHPELVKQSLQAALLKLINGYIVLHYRIHRHGRSLARVPTV